MNETSTPTTQYIQNGQPQVTNLQTAPESTPVKKVQTNINIANANPTIADNKSFNIRNTNTGYINKYISPLFTKDKQYKLNNNGDGYNLGGIFNKGQDVTRSFQNQILGDTKRQTEFKNVNEYFKTLDSNYNYTYLTGQHKAIRVPKDYSSLPEEIEIPGGILS